MIGKVGETIQSPIQHQSRCTHGNRPLRTSRSESNNVHTVLARRTHHNNARSDHRLDKRSHILVELPQSQQSKRHVDHHENRITAATMRRLLQNVIGSSPWRRQKSRRGIAGHTHGPTRHLRAVGAHVLALDKRSAAVIVGDKTLVQATRGAMGVEIRHGAARLEYPRQTR
jgi:hypothetical protein